MRIAQFAVFFLVTQGIALAVHGYLASRLGVLGMPRIAAWSLLGPLWLTMLAALVLSHSPVSHPMAKLLIWIGFAWMGSAFVLLVTGLLGQLAAAIATRAGVLAAQHAAQDATQRVVPAAATTAGAAEDAAQHVPESAA